MKWSKLILLMALPAGCMDADPTMPSGPKEPSLSLSAEPIVISSRNVYLGAAVEPIMAAGNPAEAMIRIGEAWEQVIASDPPGRAAAWADEIAAARPHLVGLQEIMTFWTQSPGDFAAGNPEQANHLEYDFLELLRAELEARGADYRVAAIGENLHIEVPMFRPSTPIPEDVRALFRDVVLARADVQIDNPRAANFDTNLEISVSGQSLVILRGWVSVDAVVGGRTVRFTSTHLEAFDNDVQEAQARQLIEVLGKDRPQLVVGDFNSRPDGSRGQAYALMREAGFGDAWRQANPDDAGFTCCQAPDLRNETSILDERIDFAFVRDALANAQPETVAAVSAWLVGEDEEDRSASGIWPSDHAGVTAALRIAKGSSD